MALLNPTPPQAVTAAVQDGLRTLIAGQIAHKYYVGGPPGIPSPADVGFVGGTPPVGHNPQQVFVLGLSGLATALGTASARPDGWRLFAGNSQGKTVLCRVVERPPGRWRLTGCSWGDQVWNALQTSQRLGVLAPVQQGNYELRVLTIPGLNLETFWLVAQTPAADDLVVPYQANQSILRESQSGPIQMATFLSVIGPMVTKRMSAPKPAIS